MKKIITALIFLSFTIHNAYSRDFSNKVLPDKFIKEKGDLLYCYPIITIGNSYWLDKPSLSAWALSNGIVEQSTITKQYSYTSKVTTTESFGKKQLFFGCWVLDKIVKETVNGKELAYAKATFKISNKIKGTPLEKVSVCKANSKKLIFNLGDYKFGEKNSIPCRGRIILPNIQALEKETTLFRLEQSYSNKKNYIVRTDF